MIDSPQMPTVPGETGVEDIDDRRLWLGNLDPRLTEYQLLKLLQKLGTIEKFDLLFHRSGPLKGQPRGYAFVTYTTKEIALKAKDALSGKKIGSKLITVNWAHDTSKCDNEKPKIIPEIPALAGAKKKKEVSREMTIQAIEARLKMMENSELCPDFGGSYQKTEGMMQSSRIPSTSSHKYKTEKRSYCDKPYPSVSRHK